MALKNYTTSIKIEKTIMEIESILAKNGATHLLKMYNDSGVPTAIAFKCIVNQNLISFKLPMEEDKILEVFKSETRKGNMPKKYFNDVDQARRTGWRIIKDWVDSQMALISINVVKIEQVFLPYIYDELQNKTLYEKIKENKFKMLKIN